MNTTLAVWNEVNEALALEAMLACCGARRWARAMVASRPFASLETLSEAADRIWSTMEEADWTEAFACHPRIGARSVENNVERRHSAKSAAWSAQEQSSTSLATGPVMAELAAGNVLYEERFGFTYIVCATGKSAEEMLAILQRRLTSSREVELREAAEQQRQIIQIRLGKWLIHE